MTQKQKLRAAILGQGRSGRAIHAETLKRLGEQFVITAIIDPLEERRHKNYNSSFYQPTEGAGSGFH